MVPTKAYKMANPILGGKYLLEFTHEFWIVVEDDKLWHFVEPEYPVDKEIGMLLGYDLFSSWREMHHL